MPTLSRAADVLKQSPAAIVVDLEGSLLPVGRAPDAARLQQAQEALSMLSQRLALAAVVSGRPAIDVAAVIGVPAVLCIGEHGLQWARAGSLRQMALTPQDLERFDHACGRIRPFLRALQGVRVEHTPTALVMEYRAAAFPQWTRGNLLKLLQPLAAAGMTVLEGRRVVELRPRGAPAKGAVVTQLAEEYGLRGIVYIGDDRMDLGAFALLRELRESSQREMHTLSIAVLNDEAVTAVPESADTTLGSPADVVEMMRELGAHHLHPAR